MVLRGTTGGKCYRLLPEKENTAVSEYDWSIWQYFTLLPTKFKGLIELKFSFTF